jgi:hypothetical protein
LLGVVKDDSAQALTEFVIVIPVVLLFFCAFLQYLVVVRASQLANYAAYAAARSYAVHASVDGEEEARKTAVSAAALAMAPVAHLVPGEIAGGTFTHFRTGLLGLAEGFIVARFVRFNPHFGGSVEIATAGKPLQVDVNINYPQPIYIPGLAELWAITGGSTDIHSDLRSLSEGLGGLVGAPYNAQQWVEGQFDRVIEGIPPWLNYLVPEFSGRLTELQEYLSQLAAAVVGTAVSRLLPFPYVNVRGKCSVGYEDWGGHDNWRPRMEQTVDSSPAVDQELKGKAEEQKRALCDYNTTTRELCLACCNVQEKYQDYLNASEKKKSQAKKDWQTAQGEYVQAHNRFDSAKSAYQRVLDTAGGHASLPDAPHCSYASPPSPGCRSKCEVKKPTIPCD